MSGEHTQADDLREIASFVRIEAAWCEPSTSRDGLRILADRLDALADTLPLRDTERAVIDAAKKARVGRLSDLGHLWVTIDALLRAEADAMRAANTTREGQ